MFVVVMAVAMAMAVMAVMAVATASASAAAMHAHARHKCARAHGGGVSGACQSFVRRVRVQRTHPLEGVTGVGDVKDAGPFESLVAVIVPVMVVREHTDIRSGGEEEEGEHRRTHGASSRRTRRALPLREEFNASW